MEAAVDKDDTPARTALAAHRILLMTDAAGVMRDFGTPAAHAIDQIGGKRVAGRHRLGRSKGPQLEARVRFTTTTITSTGPSAIGAVTDAVVVLRDEHRVGAFDGSHTCPHRLTCRRTHRNQRGRGDNEEGIDTTPFDVRVQDRVDGFHLVKDDIAGHPQRGAFGDQHKQTTVDTPVPHGAWTNRHGQDLPEICDGTWGATS